MYTFCRSKESNILIFNYLIGLVEYQADVILALEYKISNEDG